MTSGSGADFPSSLLLLVDRLEEIPSLRDPASRRLCLDLLSENLGASVFVDDFPTTRTHLIAIVQACRRQHPRALTTFIDVLEQIEPGSIPVHRARETVEDMASLDLLTESDRGELLTLLEGMPRDLLAELVRLVAGSAKLPSADSRYPAETLATLERMNARPDGIPPLLLFVEHLADQLGDYRAERLRQWNARQAEKAGLTSRLQSTGLKHDTESPGQQDVIAYLVVRIEPDLLESDRFQVAHWRHNDPAGWRPQRGLSFGGGLDEVRRHIAELVAAAEAGWARDARDIVIEFLLPYGLLNLPVDQWDLEPDGALPRPLGLHYPVVVRSLDRARSPRWHREWRRRWELLKKTRTDPASLEDHWLWSDGTRTRHLAALDARLAIHRDVVSLVLRSMPDGDEPGEVMVGLRTGVPVMIWHRTDAGRQTFVDEVAAMRDALPRLVESLRLLRGRASQAARPGTHVGSRISLLWDDPDRPVEPQDPPSTPTGEVAN